ncbi:hypothetical protein RJT34_10956 [Clitoria ternatea]|uniref:Uncharacterized protein n=1 Tax=Clitoria ternatea TaxID=43366 RepID=A0AAN9JL59_CLITE
MKPWKPWKVYDQKMEPHQRRKMGRYGFPRRIVYDNNEVKKTLYGWKQLEIEKQVQQRVEIENQRKKARLQLEQMKNTTGFQDNFEALRDFYNLIGSNSTKGP